MIKGLVHLKILFSLSDFKVLKHLTLFCLTKKEKKKALAVWLLQAADGVVKAGSRHEHN